MTAINTTTLEKLAYKDLQRVQAELSAKHRQFADSKAAVIAKIKAMADEMSLDRLEDLLGQPANTNGHAKTAKPRKSGKHVVAVKFRNPANPDQTWSGRGRMASWMADAISKGANKETFAVKR